MNDVVVVISLTSGEEVLAIMLKKMKNKIRVEYPYIVKYVSSAKSIALYPFCPLSDETVFDIKMTDIKFVVTAANHVADKFLDTLDRAELGKIEVEDYVDTEDQAQELLKIIESIPALQEKEPDPEPPKKDFPCFVEGNKTKH